MKPQYSFYFLLFFLIHSFRLVALPEDKKTFIEQVINGKICKRIEALQGLAMYAYELEGDFSAADSLALQAIDLSEQEHEYPLMLSSYCIYSRCCLPDHRTEALNYIEKGITLSKSKHTNQDFLLQIHKVLLLNRMQRQEDALKTAYSLKTELGEEYERHFIYHLTLGQLYLGSADMQSGLDNLSRAIEFAVRLENDSMKFQAFQKMIKFSTRNKLNQRATEYLDNARELLKSDTEAFNRLDDFQLRILELEYLSQTQPAALLRKGQTLLDELRGHGYKNLENELYSILRLSFMNSNDLKSLCSLYCDKRHQEHINDLHLNHPDMYFRIQALIQENNARPDSAHIYWKISESYLLNQTNPDFMATFYIRYGQFLLRQSDAASAIVAFCKARDWSLKSSFLATPILATRILDSAYYRAGNIEKAYEALRLNKTLCDSAENLMKKEQLSSLEKGLDQNLSLIESQMEREKENRKHSLQLFAIGGFVILLIYLLVFLSKKTVSVQVLKSFGYITFIFLFEFLIFLLHNVFHSITHQPILLMLMNVTLIAILLPLHHATEHRVIHYLIQKNRIEHNYSSLWGWLKGLVTGYKKFVQVELKDPEKEINESH